MSFFSETLRRLTQTKRKAPSSETTNFPNGKNEEFLKDGTKTKTVLVQDGLAILAAAGLLIFSAAARGVNLLLALGAFFIGFLIVDYHWGARTLKKLSVKRKLPGTIYAGEPFYVEIELDGTRRRSPAWSIVVEDEWEDEDSRFAVPEALAKEREAVKRDETAKIDRKKRKKEKSRRERRKSSDKKKASIPAESQAEVDPIPSAVADGAATICPVVYFPAIKSTEKLKEYYVGVMTRRGRRRLKGLTVSTRFPCGFYRSSRAFAAPENVLVLPKTGKLTRVWDAYAGSLTQETSVATSQTSRAPDETVAIRDWRSGDSSRMIAWRATAKRNRLQSREFAKRHTRTIILVLDLYVPAPDSPRKDERDPELWRLVEKAVSFTATLVKEWSVADSRLIFALNGGEVSESGEIERSSEWNEILGGGSTLSVASRLAVAVETHEDKLEELLGGASAHAPRDAQIVVVSIARNRESAFRSSDGLRRIASVDQSAALLVDVSSEVFDQYFEWNSDFDMVAKS